MSEQAEDESMADLASKVIHAMSGLADFEKRRKDAIEYLSDPVLTSFAFFGWHRDGNMRGVLCCDDVRLAYVSVVAAKRVKGA
jgi:hypothetical protein